MSTSSSDARKQYFSQNWSITIPSRPSVKFTRVTPSRFEEMIPLITNVENNEFQDTKDKIWDEAAIKKQLDGLATRYEEGLSKLASTEAFVELEGRVVGFGGVWVSGNGKGGDIGLVLNKDGRGKGLGKLTVSVFAQMCFQMGLDPTVGTMKANLPMRGVMRSLGVEEVEHIVESPERGIVAELTYSIRKDGWKEIDMDVEFEER